MRATWLLGLLAACDSPSPQLCQPCELTADLASTCDESTEQACGAVDVADGKDDATGLPHHAMVDHGGRALAHIKLWTIAWPADAQLAHDIDVFHAWMLQSPYWQILTQYGVGSGRAMGVVIVPTSAPAFFGNGTAMPENVIKQLIASGALPAPDDQTAYNFIVPAATKTPPGTGGYHSVLPNLHAPYEVMTQSFAADGSVDFDYLTFSWAHETAEVATDPFVDAWYSDQVSWFGEVGDLCNDLSRMTGPVGADARRYRVSRLFSNRRAALGLDPCPPVRAGAEHRGVVVTPIAPQLAASSSVQVTLRAFSSDPSVQQVRWKTEFVNAEASAPITVTPNHGVASIGTPVTVTLTTHADPGHPIDLDFLTVIPDPSDTSAYSGDVSQWNTEITVR